MKVVVMVCDNGGSFGGGVGAGDGVSCGGGKEKSHTIHY